MVDAAGLMRRLRRPIKRQLEMAELRRDLDACLRIFDQLSTAGSGDWSAQWAYVEKALAGVGKGGSVMRVTGWGNREAEPLILAPRLRKGVHRYLAAMISSWSVPNATSICALMVSHAARGSWIGNGNPISSCASMSRLCGFGC